MSHSLEGRLRHLIEALSSALLFLFQYVPIIGPWFCPMALPLAFYIFDFFWRYPEFREQQFYILLFEPRLIFGRIVMLIGILIFLMALIQMLKTGYRGGLTNGFYSVVRHPQYFGMIIMTLGLTIMSIEWSGLHPKIILVWFIEVFGYLLLAYYEERSLLKEY